MTHSAAVATLFDNQLPPLGRGEAMAKNEQYIQRSVRIQSTAIPAGSSFNGGRGIDCRAPVSSRPSREFAGVRIEFGPLASSRRAKEIRHLPRRTSSHPASSSNSRAASWMGDCRSRAADTGGDSSGLWGLQVFLSGGVGQRTPREGRQVAGTYGIDARRFTAMKTSSELKTTAESMSST